MPIQLDSPTSSNRPPVVAARGLGQTVIGMVVDKEQRHRQDRDGAPILNSRGRPAQEEVITIIVLDGTTGTVSGGDLNDDWTPDAGQLARVIFRGLSYGKLIDARKSIGATNVGDVITVTSPTATVWRGAGDIAARDVTDQSTIDKARVKGLSVGWDLEVTYRRPTGAEASLVAQAEAAHVDNRSRITLDATPAPTVEPDDAF